MGVSEVNQNGKYKDAFRGCQIGGAIDDALGYAVEFSKYEQIK